MNVAIVGSRDCDQEYVRRVLKDLLARINLQSVLVSGGAEGVDSLVEEVAKGTGHHVAVIRPLWDKFGQKAGMIRNSAIVTVADLFIVLYNPLSATRGCLDTAEKARKLSRPVWYIEVPPAKTETKIQ